MSKIIDEMRINNMLVLKLDNLTEAPYNKVIIAEKRFDIIPTYDTQNCIAIKCSESLIGKNVDFILE